MSCLFLLQNFHLSSVAFFGRITFDEYVRFFGLAPRRPGGAGSVLHDVAAGPSSFAAEAPTHGIHAVAGVDPLYGFSTDALTAHVQLDYARMLQEMRRREGQFQDTSTSPLSRPPRPAGPLRRRAVPRRLRGGICPEPLCRGPAAQAPVCRRGLFDLVLCAHLLFIYARGTWTTGFTSRPAAELVQVSAERGAAAPDLRTRRPDLSGDDSAPGRSRPGRHHFPGEDLRSTTSSSPAAISRLILSRDPLEIETEREISPGRWKLHLGVLD